MSYDRQQFASMKDQLAEWLLDEDHPDNQAQISAFLALGDDAVKELTLQRKLLTLCMDEGNACVFEPPSGFFEELPDKLWLELHAQEQPLDNTAAYQEFESGMKSESVFDTAITSEPETRDLPESALDAQKDNIIRFPARNSRSGKHLLMGLLMFTASVFFAVLLYPEGDLSIDDELKAFNRQLIAKVEVPPLSEINPRSSMGFVEPSEQGQLVDWGVRLAYIYALSERDRQMEIREYVDNLIHISRYPGATPNDIDARALSDLTAWLESAAKERDSLHLMKAAIWLTNLQLSTTQNELSVIVEKLQSNYTTDGVSGRATEAWQALIADLSVPIDHKQKLLINRQAKDLLALLKL